MPKPGNILSIARGGSGTTTSLTLYQYALRVVRSALGIIPACRAFIDLRQDGLLYAYVALTCRSPLLIRRHVLSIYVVCTRRAIASVVMPILAIPQSNELRDPQPFQKLFEGKASGTP